MVNWMKVGIGALIFTGGLVIEPTPLMEMYGLAVVANGVGIKQLPVGW